MSWRYARRAGSDGSGSHRMCGNWSRNAWTGCYRCFGALILAQQAARNAQRAFGLFDIDGLGEDQIRPQTKCLSDSTLTLDDCHGQRLLVESRTLGTFEQQAGVLLVVTLDHNGVKVLSRKLFDRSEGLVAGLDLEIQFAQDLGDDAGGLFVRTEKEGFITHSQIVGTQVSSGK